MKKSEDGFSVEKNIGEWYIYYNEKKDYGRINNTIMHEIGHIVLDHSEDSELAEKEVKFFAKYALVPPVLVHKLKLDNPMDIIDIFDVSFEAACYPEPALNGGNRRDNVLHIHEYKRDNFKDRSPRLLTVDEIKQFKKYLKGVKLQ